MLCLMRNWIVLRKNRIRDWEYDLIRINWGQLSKAYVGTSKSSWKLKLKAKFVLLGGKSLETRT